MTTKTATKAKKTPAAKAVKLAIIKGVDLTTGAKVFTVPFAALYVEDKFNIRDIDQEHVKGFADSYKNKRHVPAIAVQHTAKGLKVIEGHHRYFGNELNKSKEVNIELFIGTDQDAIGYMITSSQGRPIEPLERATAYQRLLDGGSTKTQIHKLTGRSRTDIDRHLLLLTASAQVKTSLKKGEIGFKAVVNTLQATPGDDGNKLLVAAIKQSKAINKTVTTKVMADAKAKLALAPADEKPVVDKKAAAGIAGDTNLLGKDKAVKSTPTKFTLEDGLKLAEILSAFDAKWLKDVNADLPALVEKYIAAGN